MRLLARKVFLTAVMITALWSWGFAQSDQGAGQDMKNAGHDVGQATSKTAHKTKRGAKKGTHKVAHKTRRGAAKVENKTAPPQ